MSLSAFLQRKKATIRTFLYSQANHGHDGRDALGVLVVLREQRFRAASKARCAHAALILIGRGVRYVATEVTSCRGR